MHFVELLLWKNIHFMVTSARRTVRQNVDAGGVSTSQHLTGDAIDIVMPGKSPSEVCNWIRSQGIEFDQLIRYNTFVHISFSRSRKKRMQYLDYTN